MEEAIIWEKKLPDGSRLYVKGVLLPLGEYREGREYMVYREDPHVALAVCKVDANGKVKEWFREGLSQVAGFHEAMAEIPKSLIVEQVLDD